MAPSLAAFIKSHGTSQFALCLAGALVAGGALATALAHVLPCPFPLKSRSKGAYVLAVFLTIKPGTLALFKEKWAAVAKSANSSAEPGCLSYELSVNPEDDCDLLIYERYVSKEDLTGPHRATAAFKAFGKWLNEESGILVAKSNKSYVETNVGHVRLSQRPRRARRVPVASRPPRCSAPRRCSAVKSRSAAEARFRLFFSDRARGMSRGEEGGKTLFRAMGTSRGVLVRRVRFGGVA
jgi:quinol monooxygenase YgiN